MISITLRALYALFMLLMGFPLSWFVLGRLLTGWDVLLTILCVLMLYQVVRDAREELQIVWWWDSWRVASYGPYPDDGPNRGCMFRWRVQLGPLELRRWK